MSGVATTAGWIQVGSECDLEVEFGAVDTHDRVVEFPGTEPTPGAGTIDSAVLRQLCDLLLLPASMMHPQERAYAVDLIHSALDFADSETRRDLAQRLAKAGNLAPSLITRLARDADLHAAQPLLRNGHAIAEDDLIVLARQGCPERAYLVAGRAKVAPAVAGVLAESADNVAVYVLLRNKGAVLTAATLGSIAERARSDADLVDPLLQREEMTPACALDLYWSCPRATRLYILKRFTAETGMVRRILNDGTDHPAPVQAPPPPAPVNPGITREGRVATVADLLARGQLDDAADALEPVIDASPALRRRIVGDRGGESITVALKAAGASRTTFASALQRWGENSEGAFELYPDSEELMDLFERLSHGHAIMAMAYWDWRETGRGPYATAQEPMPRADQR